MGEMIEAVYEQGVLKLTGSHDLKEHHRYRLLVEEISVASASSVDGVDQRVWTLADGRRVARLGGVFAAAAAQWNPSDDPIADALADLRRAREQRLDASTDEPY
jgi:predicted DNA-binding antitoxin AbrB/MazE fold protein